MTSFRASPKYEPICGDRHAGLQRYRPIAAAILQQPEALEGGGPGGPQVVHKELEVKLGRIGGAQPDAARKVGADARPQRYHSHLVHIDGAGELHEVQVNLTAGRRVVRKGVKEQELHCTVCMWLDVVVVFVGATSTVAAIARMASSSVEREREGGGWGVK